ncbi:hypothetical protein PENTCL1PPCAC_18886 [Pristionchus entomophagus]|uniref:DUF4139 domain-containing protein n=1 Tax=Pristionchus entomophagus TaxID=358040 RepID=A0AAV5TQW3_9BILA|nr:hypothetical protein PENTCL1PPCAC_18886 [Pristionchus entomophagus]
MSSPTVHSLKITKESLKKVTVFNDRAELRREFTVELAAGLNEVAVEAISQHVNDDSVRVTGLGAAVIEEVQVAQRRIVKGASDSERAASIRKEKEELEIARQRVEFEAQSVQKRIESLDGMIGQIGNGIGAPKGEKFTADPATLGSITTFFGFYEQQVGKLREEHRLKKKEIDRLNGLIAVKEHELAVIDNGDWSKDVVVLLDAIEGATTVTLEVTYQVWLAGWTPFYDVRVETKEGKTDMQLSYYANVHQNTGEEWEGAQLTLSTARPCLGGNIPNLGTLDVSFYREPVVLKGRGRMPLMGGGPRMMMKRSLAGGMASDESMSYDATPMANSYAGVNEQALSTEFSITRPCSIPADGAQHKVTIGIVTLQPQLVHESVPTKNSSAFLTASAINSSALPILTGHASVYLDGAFVAKTVLKSVSPGERFTASLGVDPAVKIEYKPAHKHHEQTGLINKWSSTVTEQKIIVKNTRGDAVLLTIKEQIPRSTDDKIKVKVISPEAIEKVSEDYQLNGNHTPKAGARILPSNNLEWTVKLDKGASQVLIVKYSVDHPSTEKIEFAERCN